ncbi:MAG: T9SS type A sorting domain-containing protein [Bacteroidia bacterium]|nr:T9SS type A sorting domain-containing protein [Bacteroidia bacterium]
MSRSTLFTVLMFSSMVSYGQNISVTFTGKGAATKIDSVKATNLRSDQSVTLPGNETLVLTVNTGIPSVSEWSDQGIIFPNPFSGTATFTTTVPKPQRVYLVVLNLFGQVFAETKAFVQPGENEFTLSLAAAGIYVVTLTTEQGTSGYKVICTEATTPENTIRYLGTGPNNHNNHYNQNNHNNPSYPGLKSSQTGYTLGYTLGDIVLYRCKSGYYSTILTDSPASSKNYDVEFVACTDPDGKNYTVVKNGVQTWMAENLAWLPSVSPSSGGSDTSPYYYVYDYEGNKVGEAKFSDNYPAYGALYNWEAAKTACPTGWHLPSEAEWTTFTSYLGSAAGGKMKETGTTHWVSPNTAATNESGFTVVPGGLRSYPGSFADLGNYSYFWTASEGDATHAWVRILAGYDDGVGRYSISRNRGYSVRCIVGPAAVLPTVTTADITAISASTATCGGNVISDGGAQITARGVCWSTSQNPTFLSNRTSDGKGNGLFSSNMSDLTVNTTYYVRAYATNSVGTAYGEQKEFTTTGGGVDGTFTDSRDGHAYKTVAIGTQTWMAENLAWLPAVSSSSSGSETSPCYYVYNYQDTSVDDAMATGNYSIYGVLYNWEGAKTACPSEWHLPSDDELKILEKNRGMSESDANAEGYRTSGTVGGKLKESGTTHWISPNAGATNSTGFTVLPGGYRDDNGAFYDLGNLARFWSSSETGSSYAWYRCLLFDLDGVDRGRNRRGFGFSVRCLQNN